MRPGVVLAARQAAVLLALVAVHPFPILSGLHSEGTPQTAGHPAVMGHCQRVHQEEYEYEAAWLYQIFSLRVMQRFSG